ncbi:helix-turn-helix domain-containing protein [Chitinophaga qingshengii]|uniref:Helix-turn-helix transcriptional regulator n=1 Tax=Chitinophaga qingshengii TaxID=1569794 RepID=A0ABR7TVK3_9BACT|nr:AraC family transcriptional regulator [Chitinophaga qingshengii]MBC9933009.1 helix-turn-helix transcriptional regulator [Chitinophaga qingshengii]
MNYYRQYYPSAQLADFIECYWVLHAPARFMDVPDRLIPGGRVELIFNFGSPADWLITADNPQGVRQHGPVIMGQRNQIFYVKGWGKVNMLGIRFKPGGLAAFTNAPVADLLNTLLPAELLLGKAVKSLETRLSDCQDDDERVQLLDIILKTELKNAPADLQMVNHSIDILRNTPDDVSIDTICRQTGWYYKKLERVFLKSVGYTPKHYHKILRFNKAVRYMRTTHILTDVCHVCNYFDQAHFIRDFRLFTGTTPGQFKKEDNRVADFLIKYQPV